MENAKYLNLVAKYLSGNLAESEREDLFSWVDADVRNRAFFEEVIELWSVSSEYEEEPFSTDTEQAWARFEGKLHARQDGQAPAGSPNGHARVVRFPASDISGRQSISWAWLRYAAAILLLVGAGLWWYADPLLWWTVEYQTARGEITQVALPDGSAVTLNGGTELTYRSLLGKRRVHLAGEAFFDVQRDESHPFEILSGTARTVVLGTVFNVRAYPKEDRIEVYVQSGSVRVEERRPARRDTMEAVVLGAGSSAVLDEVTRELRETAAPQPNATAWKTRVLRFDNLPLAEVIPVLERFYSIEMEVENEEILRCPFNSTIVDKPLDSVLRQIDLTFDKIGWREGPNGKITLYGQGCSE